MDYTGKTVLANCFFGPESVGGKLGFDSEGMTFRPHSMNIQREELRIDYRQIGSLRKFNSLKIIPNGLTVLTADGREVRFVVNRRGGLEKFLRSRIGPAHGPASV